MKQKSLLNFNCITIKTCLSVFVASFIFLLMSLSPFVYNVYDEGIIVYGAERVLNGDIPYKDFWALYTPAQFWIVAGLFKLFGSSILVERIWDVFVRSLIALVVYIFLNRLTTKWFAIIAWVLTLAWMWVIEVYSYPLFPATLLILISAYFFNLFILGSTASKCLFISGGCLTVSALFRHDIGFYALVAEIIMLIVLYFNAKKISDKPEFYKLKKNILVLLAGVLIVGLSPSIYLFFYVPLEDLIDQLFIFPATIYTKVRSESYSLDLNNIFPLYFHFIVLSIVFLTVKKLQLLEKKNSCWYPEKLSFIFLGILILLVFLKSIVRPIPEQFVHVIVLSIVLGSIVLYWLIKANEKLLALVICFSFTGMIVQPVKAYITNLTVTKNFYVNNKERDKYKKNNIRKIIRANYFHIPPAQEKAIKYIQDHVPEGERIFVGNSRHDKIDFNDITFYFLAERHSATKFHELETGLVTTVEIQKEIIEEIKQAKVSYVVITLGYGESHEANQGFEGSGVWILDEFLNKEYKEVVKFGNYSIRKSIRSDLKGLV